MHNHSKQTYSHLVQQGRYTSYTVFIIALTLILAITECLGDLLGSFDCIGHFNDDFQPTAIA